MKSQYLFLVVVEILEVKIFFFSNRNLCIVICRKRKRKIFPLQAYDCVKICFLIPTYKTIQ